MPQVGAISASVNFDVSNFIANAKRMTSEAFKSFSTIKTNVDGTINTLGGLNASLQKLNVQLQNVAIGSKEFKTIQTEIRKTQEQIDKASNSGSKFNTTMEAISSGVAAAGILSLGNSVLTTAGTFEKYNAILKNTLGTQEEATKAMAMIKDFAASTPYAVDELTSSFIKFANRGLRLTANELEAFGDTAASQGKSFDQYTEAVLDALSGENERLKEFGILASKNGDNVSYTFKGITKTVKNSSEEIKGALLEIGAMEGVKGSMKVVAATWEGALSNMGDNVTNLKQVIGEAILPIAKKVVVGISEIIAWITKFSQENKALFETVIKIVAGISLAVTGFIAVKSAMLILLPIFAALKASVVGLFALFAANPIGLVITAIGVSILAIITYWDELNQAIQPTIDSIKKLGQEFSKLFSGMGDWVDNFLKSFDGASNLLTPFIQKIKEMQPILSVIKASFAPIVVTINLLVAAVRLFIAGWNLTLNAIDAVSRRLQPLKDLVSTIVKGIRDLLTGNISLNIDLPDFTEKLKSAFNFNAISNYFSKGFAAIWNDILRLAKEFWESFKNIAKSSLDAIRDFFKNDKSVQKGVDEMKPSTLKANLKIEKVEMPKEEKAKKEKGVNATDWNVDYGDIFGQVQAVDKKFMDMVVNIALAKNETDKFAQAINGFAGMAQSMLQSVGSAFVNLLSAQSQLANAKLDNFKQKLQFVSQAMDKMTDDNLKFTINAINAQTNAQLALFDEQLAGIEANNEAQLQAEKDFQAEMKALKMQMDEESKAEADRRFEEAWAARKQDYDNQLAFVEQNTADATERAISEQSLLDQQEQEKLALRQTINDQLAADMETNAQTIEKKEAAFAEQKAIRELEEKKTRENIEQQKTAFLAEQENKRQQAQDAAEQTKADNAKKARLTEWAMGRGAFEMNKRMQTAQVQIQLASVLMSAVQAMAGMTAATLGFGAPFALALMAMISGMGIAASTTSLAAINTAQYPPPPVFAQGGIVPGNSYTGDKVPAMVNSGEMILNAGQQKTLFEMANTGNGQMGGQVTNVYYAGVQIGAIQSNNPDEIYRMVEPRIRQEIYQAVTTR